MANGKNDKKSDIKQSREPEQSEFTLESILAEYKGTAFISGDKKTPKDVLNNRAKEIVEEAYDDITGGSDIDSAVTDSSGSDAAFFDSGDDGADDISSAFADFESDKDQEPSDPVGDIIRAYTDVDEPKTVSAQDSDTIIFNNGDGRKDIGKKGTDNKAAGNKITGDKDIGKKNIRNEDFGKRDDAFISNAEKVSHIGDFFAPDGDGDSDDIGDTRDTIVHRSSKTTDSEHGFEDDFDHSPRRRFSLFKRSRTDDDDIYDDLNADGYDDKRRYREEEILPEPELKDVLHGYVLASNSISQRSFPAALVTIIMCILTFAFESGLRLPFGIGRSQALSSYTLMLMLLFVMILCADLIVRGVTTLISGVPNAETLILFSCVFSLISGAFSAQVGKLGILPYCAVSALSLTCAAFGERRHLKAITDTLKTAAISSQPYGVIAEYNSEIDKSVLKKVHNRTDGFYNNLVSPDISELVYRYATPLLLIAAVFLSAVTALFKERGSYFFHILSALLAGAAPLTVMLSFSLPFGSIVSSARKTGAAVAGWGGTDEVCFTDGACVTDDDLFPPGTISFSGDARLYNGVSPTMALRCTGSIIIASDSGLAGVFEEVLRLQNIAPVKVEEFAAFEGGVSALVNGVRVMTGSAAFMNLLGIRIPDDSNMKNAVYTAIDGQLGAMFAIDYKPINSVQGALISILRWRVKLFFAMRDFNVTPLMLEQKFKVSLDDIEYIQARDSYNISDPNSNKEGRIAALLTREGLGPFTEVLTGCKLLKSTSMTATAISIISAALGILLMFIMCWSGAFLAARPGNLMLYMISMLLAVFVVSGYVKFKK